MAQFKLSHTGYHGANIRKYGFSWTASHVATTDTSNLSFDLNETFVCWDGNGNGDHSVFIMGKSEDAIMRIKLKNGQNPNRSAVEKLRTDVDKETEIKIACAELFNMDYKTLDFKVAIDGLREIYKYIPNKAFEDFKIAMLSDSMSMGEREQYVADYAEQRKFKFHQIDAIGAGTVRYLKNQNYYHNKHKAKTEPADE